MLKYLVEKEFKQIFRNPILPRVIIVLPFVILALFPMVANFEIRDLKLSIVDNDHSDYSSDLVQKIAASRYFEITDASENYTDALKSIELNDADIILEIPSDFEDDLIREGKTKVLISANTVNATKGGIGSAYLSNILMDFNNDIRSGHVTAQVKTQSSMMSISPLFLFNPKLKYYVFMIPALMVMMMAMVCGFIPALNIVLEKERGTIEQLNVTPVNKFIFIISKLIPYWIIGFVVLTICFGVAWLFYGLLPAGNIITIYLFVSVFIIAFSGLGLVISNVAKSLQQATFLMFFFVIVFIFLSGLYTPVNNMPDWAKVISTISPLKYLMEVLRSVYLKGSSFFDLLPQFLYLVGFAVLFSFLAMISYRKKNG
jgi:ABC-2 type transport system permease protein